MLAARDAQVHRLLAGELSYGLARNEWLGPPSRFSLIADMNETLRDPHATCAVFAQLEALFPSARTAPRLAGELSNFAGDLRLRTAILRGLGRDAEAGTLNDDALAGLATDEMRDWVQRDLAAPGAIIRAVSEHRMAQDEAANNNIPTT